MANPKTINLEEYDIIEDQWAKTNDIELVNVAMAYFRTIFHPKSNFVFANIEYSDPTSTNKCMEFFYEQLHKFNESTEEDKSDLFDMECSPSMHEVKELYLLNVDYKPLYTSKYLIPLFKYLSQLDWSVMKWSIIPLN